MIEVEVPAHYTGREQAFVKHHFLRNYLERLVHKIASVYDEVVYIDGYSGPWKSGGEAYGDTSFGIALQSMTAARQSWLDIPQRRRNVRMTAHLVEKQAQPFAELQTIGTLFPEVTVHPHRGDFLALAPNIATRIPTRAFSFSLIDPKGFKLDLESLRPLLARKQSEVVFNFMYDFANRFTSLDSLADTYDRLLPGIDWRTRLAVADAAGPTERKAAFVRTQLEAQIEEGEAFRGRMHDTLVNHERATLVAHKRRSTELGMELEVIVRERTQNLRRLEAQRNELNSKVRLPREELSLLHAGLAAAEARRAQRL